MKGDAKKRTMSQPYHWMRLPSRYIPARFRYRYHPPIAHLVAIDASSTLCGLAVPAEILMRPNPRRPCRSCRRSFLKANPSWPWPWHPTIPLWIARSKARGEGGKGVGGSTPSTTIQPVNPDT